MKGTGGAGGQIDTPPPFQENLPSKSPALLGLRDNKADEGNWEFEL